MTFISNIPQPGDKLSKSQGQLLTNNQGLDTIYGTDHYAFTNATANKGHHNLITTPAVTGAFTPDHNHPPTTTNDIIYAFEPIAAVGLLNFSRGVSNAVPTPITSLCSGYTAIIVGAGGDTDVLDFTGLSNAVVTLYGYDVANDAYVVAVGFWDGTTLIAPVLSNNKMTAVVTTAITLNTLTIRNLTASPLNVFWTLTFQRLDTP